MPLPPFAFVAKPLDRSDALRDDPRALAQCWQSAQVVVLDEDGRAYADAACKLLPLSGARLSALTALGHQDGIFLGIERNSNDNGDGCGWFVVGADQAGGMQAPQRVDLRTAAATWPTFESTVFAQARAMLHWRTRHRFCSGCGGVLLFFRGGWEARCDACDGVHYPRTDPAIIVAVTDGEHLLLGRQASWPPQRYSTLAGFVEPGESLEQALVREVLEESGVRVHIDRVRYLASQPWPFPGSLMLGFIADAEPDAPRIGAELEDARWFTRDEIGAALKDESGVNGLKLSPSISISRWLIEGWYEGVGSRERQKLV